MSKVKAIAKGTINNALRLNSDVEAKAAERYEICKGCENYKHNQLIHANWCSPNSTTKHAETGEPTKGCGCPIQSKIRQDEEPCPAAKWK